MQGDVIKCCVSSPRRHHVHTQEVREASMFILWGMQLAVAMFVLRPKMAIIKCQLEWIGLFMYVETFLCA